MASITKRQHFCIPTLIRSSKVMVPFPLPTYYVHSYAEAKIPLVFSLLLFNDLDTGLNSGRHPSIEMCFNNRQVFPLKSILIMIFFSPGNSLSVEMQNGVSPSYQ